MDNENELLDSQEPTEVEENVDTSEEIAALEEKNRQLFERAKKAEKKVKEVSNSLQDKEEVAPPEPQIKDVNERMDNMEQYIKLGRQGYSDDEIDFIKQNAPNGNIDKALESPFVKAAIEAQRNEEQVEGATPSSSNAIPVLGEKTFSQVINDNEVSDTDKDTAYDAQVANLLKKK